MDEHTTKLDHLVIGAKDLAQGVAYVKDMFGVEIPFGGVHEMMGTHNHLMRLGEGLFLEVIAANPHMASAVYPRWYALDDPYVRQQLEWSPSLLTWVVRTDDIHALLSRTDFSFGQPQKISRGDLTWYFGLPGDGRLLASGMLPYVMQWQTEGHPASAMPDLGCSLKQLEIHHPRTEWIGNILDSIQAAPFVRLEPLSETSQPYLSAHFETPQGVKTLRSCGYHDS